MEKDLWTQQSLVISVPMPMLVISLVVTTIIATMSIIFLLKSKQMNLYTDTFYNQQKEVLNESPYQVEVSKRQLSRMEEEHKRQKSSEYTRRGQIWSRHASWYLPKAPRQAVSVAESHGSGVEPIKALLRKFDIDMLTGFLPAEEPLQRLPYARYHLWEDLGDDLPRLLGARLGQARGPLEQLPVLSIDKLTTNAELRRAHLLLCLFAHAYVFGGNEPLDVLPAGISVPLTQVSTKLGIPPVLGHPSIVLYNWRRLDSTAAICMENLATLNNFFDGRDESWFYLITVEVEARGAGAIVPTMLAIDAIQRYREQQDDIQSDTMPVSMEEDDDYDSDSQASTASEADAMYSTSQRPLRYEALLGVLSVDRVAKYAAKQLVRISASIEAMGASMSAMREGCHPFIFYHRVRPFLSGWKHNPALPLGVLYSDVSPERHQYYGGSAAQSALLPVLDIALGVAHDSHKSRDFLLAMRDYMLQPHREFLVHLENVANIRDFVLEMQQRYLTGSEVDEMDCSRSEAKASIQQAVQVLVSAYDSSVTQLRSFRTIHMSLVADYIMAQQRGGSTKPKVSAAVVSQEEAAVREEAVQSTAPPPASTSAAETEVSTPKKGLEHSAGGKGTGGTDLMNFLRPIRDDCKASLLGAQTTSTNAKESFSSIPMAPAALSPSVLPHTAAAEQTQQERIGAASMMLRTSASEAIQAEVAHGEEVARQAAAALEEKLSNMPRSDSFEIYYKDNGSCADIDLYRGATSSSRAPYAHAGLVDSATAMPSYTFTGYRYLSSHHSGEGNGSGSTTPFPREVMVT